MNIIFGTKKLGQIQTAATSEKYPGIPVITVEGLKGAKKSRRILLNRTAAELLNCEVGDVQHLVFASVEAGSEVPTQVLIANASTLPSEVDVTYKTSKNRVSYGEDTSEKGKAITSSHACREIFSFLSLNDTANVEFRLNSFDNPDLEAFSLVSITSDTVNEIPSVDAVIEGVIETNNAVVTAEDVVNETIAEVQKAQAADPIFDQEVIAEEVFAEETGSFEQDLVSDQHVDSEWS